MRIKEIWIENYKSIKNWQKISFDSKMITFIGKNGSGKTNILEALDVIFESNNGRYFPHERIIIDYKIILELEEIELKKIDGSLAYDEVSKHIEVYCSKSEGQLRVDRVKNIPIIKAIREKEKDLLVLSKKLDEQLNEYGKLVEYSILDDGYSTINYVTELISDGKVLHNSYDLKRWLEYLTKDAIKIIEQFSESEEYFIVNEHYPFTNANVNNVTDFKLSFRKPKLSRLEENYIKIDEKGLIEEIEVINQKTEHTRNEILATIQSIMNIVNGVNKLFDLRNEEIFDSNDRYIKLISDIQKSIGKRTFFLKNDNNSLIFNKNINRMSYSNINEKLILEAYVKTYVTGEEQERLLNDLNDGKLQVTNPRDFSREMERIINNDIPEFDKGMYKKVKVSFDDNNQFSLTLLEKNGEEITFNETNNGRRWYFTYYFIKKCLRAGDVFILDEPAAFLHPDAQTEVLNDLVKLSRKGIQIIYSTHSPYIMPTKVHGMYITSMGNEGTMIKKLVMDEDSFDYVKNQIGIYASKDFLIKLSKKMILVEGMADQACITKFMEYFKVNQNNYNVYVCNGDAILDTIMFCISNKVDFVALLDRDNLSKPEEFLDRKKHLRDYIPIIRKDKRCVFTPENKKQKSIEDLFTNEDLRKIAKKVNGKMKIQVETIDSISITDMSEETRNNFKDLFKEMKIKIKS